MLKDEKIIQAVASILKRAEKQQDIERLLDTYVDVGIISQLSSKNNQVVYGRRGTGKTHIFKVLSTKIAEDRKNSVVYIDARTLGSSSQFSDLDIPIKQRCISLFRDLVTEIHNSLLDSIIRNPSDYQNAAFEALNDFSTVLTKPISTVTPESLRDAKMQKNEDEKNREFGFKSNGLFKISASKSESKEIENLTDVRYKVVQEDKIIFPELSSYLNDVLIKAELYLYIFIDEWASLPIDIQPYLAEFLKRSFLPNPKVILKIASLEYRSKFCTKSEPLGHIGFELGADISADIDIDDYFVYEKNPNQITAKFADIIYKHIKCDLPANYLESKFKISSGSKLVAKLFTHKNSFEELIRASEGVIRDFICIFSMSFFDSQRKGRSNIENKSVLEAARTWFEQDKSRNISDQLQAVLGKIVSEVIGNKRARSFLIPRELESHSVIQQLFDLRLIHIMKRGYADKFNPGIRYNIYSLDYGTYVDLINTSKEPEMDLKAIPTDAEIDEKDFVVPFDDKRSIRRIILTKDILFTQ